MTADGRDAMDGFCVLFVGKSTRNGWFLPLSIQKTQVLLDRFSPETDPLNDLKI